MKYSRHSLTLLATALSHLAFAQDNNNNFNNNAQIPTTCSNGFESRSDTVFLALPYPYDAVIPLVSDFNNLSWANISPVTLNGTNNTPGTARAFSFGGADFIQTLLSYDKPPSPGPFVEVHNSAPVTLSIPPEQVETAGGKTNFTLWLDSLRFEVEGVCEGRASQVNWTVSLCSDGPDVAKGMLHMVHTGFVENVGKLLGGGEFEGCEALGGGGEKEGGDKEGEKKEGEEKEDEEDEDEDEEDEKDEKDEKEEDEDEDEKDEKDEDKDENEKEDEDEDKKDGEKKETGSEEKKKPSQSYGEPPHYRRWVA
ncbi:hypothetical protein CKM354_001220400 [Cercospora kikuchii]|uniref:Uncharacterized protein n=1 Tax=Cercospora kikuchii TaxID=84275 RepID=A0A9P3FLJ5_9PEZI|nr:uncharacterized protein CKM354_001220400 [Cercospora kikuchii]GIZ49169.1 hypothetical protein CKM354_001220400 [Cercospora kikuchii]